MDWTCICTFTAFTLTRGAINAILKKKTYLFIGNVDILSLYSTNKILPSKISGGNVLKIAPLLIYPQSYKRYK